MSEQQPAADAVGEGTRVYLNFSLSLESGEEIDSNFGAEPVSFAFGDGNLLPGFERHLVGMRPGERRVHSVPPEDAFGQPNEQNVQRIDRENFDDDIELQHGLVLSFADASGGEVPGMIVAFDEQEVTVDFNHPLAGRTILFDVQIHRVEAAELH
jgi:FKBP-type peptidyl-prolyl cis-trans isomerase SlpA